LAPYPSARACIAQHELAQRLHHSQPSQTRGADPQPQLLPALASRVVVHPSTDANIREPAHRANARDAGVNEMSQHYGSNDARHQPPSTRDLLRRLAADWPRRAQVKRVELDAAMADEDKDDFLADLLPFKDHPLYLKAPPAMKRKVLSCGWLAYNEKTVDI